MKRITLLWTCLLVSAIIGISGADSPDLSPYHSVNSMEDLSYPTYFDNSTFNISLSSSEYFVTAFLETDNSTIWIHNEAGDVNQTIEGNASEYMRTRIYHGNGTLPTGGNYTFETIGQGLLVLQNTTIEDELSTGGYGSTFSTTVSLSHNISSFTLQPPTHLWPFLLTLNLSNNENFRFFLYDDELALTYEDTVNTTKYYTSASWEDNVINDYTIVIILSETEDFPSVNVQIEKTEIENGQPYSQGQGLIIGGGILAVFILIAVPPVIYYYYIKPRLRKKNK